MNVDLVIRAQQGDQQAFASLAEAIAIRLRKVAFGVLRDMDLAEEAAQQAILAIWRDLPRLRDPARFEPWCFRLLVRRCHAERRRHAKQATVPLGAMPLQPAIADVSHDVVLRDQLARGFARLSFEHRTVIVLHHQVGLSLDEIGEALELPTGTVKSRLHRAMQQLRASLEADLRNPSVRAREEVSL
jgi:RNA polymerase sigma-70 factor, ECF subfamily